MKTASKLMGVFLVLVLALTLVGFQATSATAGDQKWTRGPNAQIGDAGRLLSTTDILAFDVAPDNTTIITGGATSSGGGIRGLHKSTNGGDSFAPPKSLPAAIAPSTDAFGIVAIKFSPNYATDKTVYVATSNDLYRSNDEGNTYNAYAGAFSAVGASATVLITSMDVGIDSAGNTVVAIGTEDTGGTFGEVWAYKSDTGTWVDQNVARNTAVAVAANTTEVLAVKFSNRFASDGVLFAFVTGANRISTAADPARVVTKWSNFNLSTTALWGANWFDTDTGPANPFLMAGTVTMASLTFPADFDVINVGKNYYYVGLADSTADPAVGDAFRITGHGPGSGFTISEVKDLGLGADVNSLAFIGNITGGTLLMGLSNQSVVQRTTDVLSNTPVFTPATKSPVSTSATPNVMVKAASTGSSAWAANQGELSGFHKSTDSAVTFNGTSLLRTSVNSISDFAVNPANLNEIVAVAEDATGTLASNVWRTDSNGDKWVRVWADTTGVANTIDSVKLSPTYATDKTFYLIDLIGTRIWRTADSGATFVGVSAPLSSAGLGVRAWVVETGTNLIVGYGNGEVHRSISNGLTWVKSVTGAGTSTILDLLINPKDAKEVFAVNTSGQVNRSRDNAVTFRKLESDMAAITNGTIALADEYDATRNPVVFVASNTGIFRQKIGTEVRWDNLATGAFTTNFNGLVTYASETLVASGNVTAGTGVMRSIAAHRMTTTTPAFARATFNDAGILSAAILTKLLKAVTGRTGTTLFMVETSTGTDTIHSYNDNLSSRIVLQLPRTKSGVADVDRLNLTWTGIRLPDAGVYRVVVGYDYNAALDDVNQFLFDSNTAVQNTTGSGFRLVNAALEPGKTYFWYVQGRFVDASADVITSPKGRHAATARGVTTYTTGEFYTGVAKPQLISPVGGINTGGVNTSLKPALSWNSVDGANRYELQVDTSASFFAPFVNLTDTGRLDATAYQIDKNLEYETTYYWRVRAATFTSLGDWSTVGAFTTMAKPVAAAPPVIIQQAPAPVINIPAPTTPSWVWVVIVIGAILVIVMLVLIVRTRRV